MIRIADINKELDRYISSRRSRKGLFKRPVAKPHINKDVEVVDTELGFWERLFSNKKKNEPVSEDLTPEEMENLKAMQDEMVAVESAEKKHPEVAEELEEVHDSLITRFFKLFRFYDHKHVIEQEDEMVSEVYDVADELRSEIQTILKMMHKWLSHLSKRERDAFKNSKDSELYTSLLEKYGVAKRK